MKKRTYFVLSAIPFSLYGVGFYVDWKASLIVLVGATIGVILSEVYKSDPKTT